MSKIAESLQAYKVTLQSSLQDTHPKLLGDLDCILSLLASVPGGVIQESSFDGLSLREISETSVPQSPNHIQCEERSSSDAIVGDEAIPEPSSTFDASPETDIICFQEAGENSYHQAPPAMQKHMEIDCIQPIVQAVGRPIGAHVLYTYSFLESSFTRRLKRSSLEHAFRIFSDSHSHPLEVFRVFRLVPCFRERAKMYPFFKNLVTSSRGHSLEISALPFYSIGGAGTHYPAKDQAGDPIYPPKMRVPRRILGILPMAGAPGDSSFVHQSQSQSHLELCGFGGEWFDCRDVEGYLREKGVDIDGSSVFPTVYNLPLNPGSSELGNGSLDQDGNNAGNYQTGNYQNGNLRHAGIPSADGPTISPDTQYTTFCISQTSSEIFAMPQQPSRCVLHLESFLAGLLRGVAILGRAPGFRRSDVEIAFQSALQMRD